jgi:VIT1/CCC1 family predicted Fe2+/Mn2+ transporter
MNKNVKRSLLKSLGLNILAGIVGMIPFIFLRKDDPVIMWGFALIIIAVISILVQLIVALVYINKPERKETGQGMLLSVGILLLIGVAVCTPFWF